VKSILGVILNKVKDLALLTRQDSSRALRMTAFIIFSLFTFSVSCPPNAYAWTWDDEELENKDELDVQLAAYRARVESGIALQERVVLLDRLIKLFQVHKRDTKPLEDERAQLMSDETAIQTVSLLSRQKAQDLFQKAFEQIRSGNYKQAQEYIREAEHLNPTDKIIAELRVKIEQVASIMPQAPADPNTGDLVKRGVVQFMQNETSRALNFMLYAQQKNPADPAISDIVELIKRSSPNDTGEILDARLNLIDQKLQRALEKIYAGEYLVAAKECQEGKTQRR
jgi:tetratricopeptide (TPR) repeat protein